MVILMTLRITPIFAQGTSSDPLKTPFAVALWPPYQLPSTCCSVYGFSLGILEGGTLEAGLQEGRIQSLDFSAYRGEDYIYGFQIAGLFSFAKELCGFQVSGLGNFAQDIPVGVQAAGLFNYVENDMGVGVQVAGIWNRYESGAGLQVAMVNAADKDFIGIQIGLCNWGDNKSGTREGFIPLGLLAVPQTILGFGSRLFDQRGVEDMRGLQLGLVSKASDMYGIQCGVLWNNAKCVRGLQLGLVNIADTMTGFQVGLVNIIRDNPVPFLPIINASF